MNIRVISCDSRKLHHRQDRVWSELCFISKGSRHRRGQNGFGLCDYHHLLQLYILFHSNTWTLCLGNQRNRTLKSFVDASRLVMQIGTIIVSVIGVTNATPVNQRLFHCKGVAHGENVREKWTNLFLVEDRRLPEEEQEGGEHEADKCRRYDEPFESQISADWAAQHGSCITSFIQSICMEMK